MGAVMAARKEYGIGLLGCGFIGKVHMYGHHVMPYYYENLPWRARFVAVCTSRPETARRAADELGFELGTTEAARVIENPKVDVVHICTPNALHRDELLAAIRAGKHIYCDKPLTSTWDEAKDVLAALNGYTGTHQMTFHNRFFTATLRARQLIEEGAVGDVTCFRCEYLHAGSVDPKKELAWKLDAAMGGGVINDLATHVIDLMQHLIGSFDDVLCATRVLYRQRPSRQDRARVVPVEAEDHAVLLMRRDDGLVGTIEATKIATGAEDELRFEIHGTRGALRFNLMEPNWLEFFDAGAPDKPLGGRSGWTRIPCVQRYESPAGKWPTPKGSIGWLRGHVHCL
jgi:predicted dehydrogenase